MQPRDIDFDENESQQDCASVATNRRESESGEGVIASGAGTPFEGEGGVPELRDVRELTPIQVSYLRGREPGQPYGGVDCLALFEFRREVGEGRPGAAKSCPLDPEALRRAVASLKRHPVMRSVIVDGSHWSACSHGDDSLPLTISIDDRPNVDGLAENRRNAAANIDNICREKRSEILLRRADYATGELGWIDVGYVGSCEVIHIAISLVASDLGGVGVIINDLAAAYAAYAGTGRSVTDEDRAPDWRTFGDIAEREREYERDRAKNAKSAKDARNTTKIDGGAFATTVADALPLPPALPAPGNGGGADGVSRSVTRHSGVLGIPQWERLGRIAEAAGASRPGLLLAIYRHALGLWDPAERLSIVMPGMDKRATPDDVLDRTRAWITRCATSPGITLGKAARGATEEVRRRIRASLDSDDELRRARSRGDDHPGILPVVLTCGSEEVLLSPEVRDVFGQLAYTGSVTPQVLCDLQVLRLTADEVRVALDVRDGAYADTVGEELFSAFFGALRSLAEAAPDTDAAALAALPLDDVVRVAGDTAARRRALNGTAAAPDALLHAPFLERVEQTPDATALIDPGNGEPLTYAELHRAALALADELADAVQPGDLVGIRLPKGRDQITAVLAVLYLGAAYLPIGAHAPQRRVDAICKAAAPVAIIDGVDGSVYERLTTDPPRHASLPRTVAPTDRAYVIFTSGSTGTPKGVVMSHAAASNTILAVRAQHGLGAEDRVLAVSELDFDLSVFDIFGLLGAGGAIVCIADDQRRDAFAWADLVRRYGVTVWNSAPALAEMLVLVGGDPLPLRTVLVSGDWVSLSLPERLRAVARADGDRGVRLVAMGGATEAGIWSNQHIIDSPADLPPDWPSIPYGHPLPGQAYRVVDERGRDCPTGVVGELWIGGRSLADGYLGREELTRERFVTVDDRSGQDDGPTHRRWYRTGDHGYWARTEHRGETADLMFFVGRRDNQVKIRGHRVELGDVEHHLRKIPGVDVAVVLPEPGNRALLALVSPEPGAVLDGGALRVALAGEVPEFMVPRKITVSSSMVLTANGKIDRAWAAEKLADDGADDAGAAAAPNDGAVDATGAGDSVHAATGDATAEIEAAVRRAWRAVLDEPWLDRIGDDPNFFALGGDSVGATEACARLRAEGMPVSAADLFANPRLNHFVEVCAKKTAADGGAYVSSGSAARGDSRPEGHAEDPAEDPANDGQPFPLLPLQRAYALGVDGIVGTVRSRTVYATILRRGGGSERAGGPAVEKRGFSRDEVTEVGRRIVGSCPALRVVRVDDDTQRVVDAERAFTVTVVGDAAGAAGLRGLLEDRDPATPIEFILPREGSAELGILIDYIALDGRSLAEIVGALAAAFSGRDHALSGSIARFAAYCRDRAQVALGAVAPAAQESAGSMPQPPVLPVQRLPRHSTGFRSFRAAVPAHVLARRAENHGVMASAYLLAEYGAVLAEASGIGEVGIVVPFGHRPEEVTGERCELGLFTHLGVCRCAATPDHAEIQRQLAAQVDGDGAPARVSSGRTGRYPAVFTSVIGYDGVATDFGDVLPVWSLTRTPGVLIDCQVTTEGEDGDRIGIRWDIPKKVLDEQRISAMFSRFADAVGAEVAPASAASSAPRRERGSARRTVTELLREVTGIIDAGAADEDRMLAWARPVVAAWRRFVELGPEGTGLEDAAIAWTARDARYLADVVRGRARRFSVLEHPRLSPRALALADPMVGQALSVFERRLNESPASTVVELGYAADPSRIGDDRTWIVVEPDERIADIATVDGRTCVGGVGDLRSPVDLVLACGTLHRDPRLAEALRRVPLAPGAEIHLIEAERLTAASLVSAAVVDPSILDGDPTVAEAHDLMAALADRDLALRFFQAEDGHTLVLRAVADDAGACVRDDRKSGGVDVDDRSGERSDAASMLEGIWRRHLPVLEGTPSPLGADTDFFRNGGDSLSATRVLADLQAAGVDGLRAVDVFNRPTFGELLELLRRGGSGGRGGGDAAVPRWAGAAAASSAADEPAASDSAARESSDADKWAKPWPLTRVQRAYLSGENPGQLLGGTQARCWFLFDAPALDPDRLIDAANAVAERHPLLRAVLVDGAGAGSNDAAQFTARPLEDLRPVACRTDDPAGVTRALTIDHRSSGPLFVAAGDDAVGISMSNLLLDGTSMMKVMDELSRAYRDTAGYATEPGAAPIDLADYLGERPWLADDSATVIDPDGPVAADELRRRLDRVLMEMPPAPLVPDRTTLETLSEATMSRVSGDLPTDRWRELRSSFADRRVTPAAAVMAAFARALARCTGRDALTLNLTRFERDISVPGILEALGDFTSLSLVGLRDLSAADPSRIIADAQAALVDADRPEHDALRLAARKVQRSGDPMEGLFPVVFTCGLGMNNAASQSSLRERSFGAQLEAGSTTPQVVLDLQVIDDSDGLHLTADHLAGVLPPDEAKRIVDSTLAELDGFAPNPGRTGSTASEDDPVTSAWAEALGKPAHLLDASTNFFQEGGDSLGATAVVRRLRDNGIDVSLRTLLANPALGAFRERIGGSDPAPVNESAATGDGAIADDEWFDITDVQAGYLMGRTGAYEDGGVACQGYAEFTLDVNRLGPRAAADPASAVRTAWAKVVDAHEMLRAVIDREGRQRIDRSADVPVRVVEVPGDDVRAAAERAWVRDELCTKNYPVGRAPMMDIVLTIGCGAPVVHLSVDLIISDYVGIRTLVADLDAALAHPDRPIEAPPVSFREWIEGRNDRLGTPEGDAAVDSDRRWWQQRLDSLPAALAFSPDTVRAEREGATTTRRSFLLDDAAWAGFRRAAAQAGVTPSCLMLGAFMATARRHADIGLKDAEKALVTLTTVNRSDGPGDLSRVVGDFTSTVLLDAPMGTNVAANALGAQDSLAEALDHRNYSGVRVLRDLRKAGGDERGLVPVVFTSTVGVDEGQKPRVLRSVPGSAISKTPQVLLDVQLSPAGDGVSVDWDTRDGGFHPGVLDRAFADFRTLVVETAGAGTVASLPERTLDPVEAQPTLADITGERADAFLHGPFLGHALENPDMPAVIDRGRTFSRADVCAMAADMAASLPDGTGPLIVDSEPGVEQIAAQFAALLTGRAFVPVDSSWPDARRDSVRDTLARAAAGTGGAADLISDEPVELPRRAGSGGDVDWRAVVRRALDDLGDADGSSDRLAYVIFTSGSTGAPKGVAVTHSQVRTTLDDMHRRLDLSCDDRVLAISRPSFDLAVFNVFGLLGAGGAVVMPTCGTVADPETWIADMCGHGVTVWNSVPAQLTIALDYLDDLAERRELPLRCLLVSGDLVPADQPARLRTICPGAEFLALGGATEGSIWSIVHRCRVEDDALKLPIPYGRALDGQGMWVVNRDGEPAAIGQRGEIAITGGGVAEGYLCADGRRDGAFGTDPATGDRMYRTGDVGVLSADGEILFGGRVDDRQVKVRGHRIEFGEVEAGLRSIDGIADALVTVDGDGERGGLVAVVTSSRGRQDGADDPLQLPLSSLHGEAAIGDRAPAFRRIHDLAVAAALDAMAVEIARGVDTLKAAGPEDADAVAPTVDEVAEALGASERAGLVRRWVKALVAGGRVRLRRARIASVAVPGDSSSDDSRWREIERLDTEIGYGTTQLRYLRECLENLPGLLDGTVDPLSLLFPEGDMSVARAAYGENMLSRYLNSICGGVIAHHVSRLSESRPCRIVEIGGGVGGTTVDVLDALLTIPPHRWDYLFTDVSRYFTDEAERKWPQVRTGLFDVNLSGPEQGIPDGSADVVLCANALHNAKHVGQALEAIWRILAPGGIAVIIDSTADSAPLMASMEFKEGLDGATDLRAETGSPFLTLEEWREMIDRSPLGMVSALPPAGDVLELGAQHVFVLRRPAARAGAGSPSRVPQSLFDEASRVLPGYMVPRRMAVAEALPMTANGKRDRAAVAAAVDEAHRAAAPYADGAGQPGSAAGPADSAVPPVPAEAKCDGPVPVIDSVEAAWREVLDLEPDRPLPDDADFHDLGGDSLLLARCIGKMRRALDTESLPNWDETLRAIVADPTPNGCRRALGLDSRASDGSPVPEVGPESTAHRAESAVAGGATSTAAAHFGDEDAVAPVISKLHDAAGPVIVLVHDGSGTTGPYKDLVAELRARDAGTVFGVERCAGDGYLGMNPRDLFRELIERYTGALLEHLEGVAEPVKVVGYCMGGLLAVSIADRLAACGVEARAVVISSYRIPFTVSDPRLLDFSFARLINASPRDMGIDLDEDRLSEAIGAARDAGVTDISAGTLDAHASPRLRGQLASMPLESGPRFETFLASPAGADWQREALESLKEVYVQSLAAVAAFDEPPAMVPVTFLRQSDPLSFLPEQGSAMTDFWEGHCLGGLEVIDIDGDHFTCIDADHAVVVAGILKEVAPR